MGNCCCYNGSGDGIKSSSDGINDDEVKSKESEKKSDRMLWKIKKTKKRVQK
jgi:hypothetical protein